MGYRSHVTLAIIITQRLDVSACSGFLRMHLLAFRGKNAGFMNKIGECMRLHFVTKLVANNR